MIMTDKKIELLAPAKNKECAFAAINAGADAVYLGAESFGARKKAGNSIEDIKEIVEYAHKFLVKIYVTVNTIIFDNELDDVEKLIWQLYEIGVDAVIFQDFSFFEMNLPPIALHASTQCNNDSLDKIKFLKQLNVERVVLPREFSLKEIKNVTENVDIETEVFVHGALCVSYSGQCYYSNYIGGRSANRGECAQPCRRKYSLVDDKGNVLLEKQYLLSMKDNNLSAHLKELICAGVTSLKIEGRLKDKEYVTNVVSYYRQAIDSISKTLKASEGEIITSFVPNPDKTFNRGYTNFYFDGKRKKFINPLTPKFMGEKIGTVKFVKGKSVVIDSKHNLNPGDRLAYFDRNSDLTGTTVKTVNKTAIEVLDASSIKQGTVLYRNYDSLFYKSLNSAEFKRKIPVKIFADNKKIVIKSFDNNQISYEYKEDFETANNIEKAKDTIAKQLAKLGDTEFFAKETVIDEAFNLFIPVSKLNEIRREAVKQLVLKSKENYKFQRRDTKIEYKDYPIKSLDYSFNISNTKAKDFYEKCGCNIKQLGKQWAPEHTECSNITLMKTKHCLRDFAGICLKKSKDTRKLFLIDEYGKKYPLNFDCKKCIMKIEITDI